MYLSSYSFIWISMRLPLPFHITSLYIFAMAFAFLDQCIKYSLVYWLSFIYFFHSLPFYFIHFLFLPWILPYCTEVTEKRHDEPIVHGTNHWEKKKIAVRPFGVWETERQRWKATEWNWTNCIAFFLMTVTWYASIDVRLHWLWLRDNSIKTNHLPVPYILCFLIFQLNEQRLNKQDYTAKICIFFLTFISLTVVSSTWTNHCTNSTYLAISFHLLFSIASEYFENILFAHQSISPYCRHCDCKRSVTQTKIDFQCFFKSIKSN